MDRRKFLKALAIVPAALAAAPVLKLLPELKNELSSPTVTGGYTLDFNTDTYCLGGRSTYVWSPSSALAGNCAPITMEQIKEAMAKIKEMQCYTEVVHVPYLHPKQVEAYITLTKFDHDYNWYI